MAPHVKAVPYRTLYPSSDTPEWPSTSPMRPPASTSTSKHVTFGQSLRLPTLNRPPWPPHLDTPPPPPPPPPPTRRLSPPTPPPRSNTSAPAIASPPPFPSVCRSPRLFPPAQDSPSAPTTAALNLVSVSAPRTPTASPLPRRAGISTTKAGWVGVFVGMEECIDRGRAGVVRMYREVRGTAAEERIVAGNRDFVSTVLAGIGTAGLFSVWHQFPVPTAARVAKMGARIGLVYGVLQDCVGARTNPLRLWRLLLAETVIRGATLLLRTIHHTNARKFWHPSSVTLAAAKRSRSFIAKHCGAMYHHLARPLFCTSTLWASCPLLPAAQLRRPRCHDSNLNLGGSSSRIPQYEKTLESASSPYSSVSISGYAKGTLTGASANVLCRNGKMSSYR
ncbi:hypothetical protein KC341_g14 [Hortaea werneckii]|nr:hypothetical protein KC341_g14 [Hortaea werneckii]